MIEYLSKCFEIWAMWAIASVIVGLACGVGISIVRAYLLWAERHGHRGGLHG